MTTQRDPDTNDTGPTVYFDGSCPICSREVAAYRRMAGAERLRWVDAARCEAGAMGTDLDRETALARMHVRRADGTLATGAAAFAELWSAIPRLAWLGRFARLPGVRSVAELAYAGFLRVRPLITRRDSKP